jgi:hypothetical protein
MKKTMLVTWIMISHVYAMEIMQPLFELENIHARDEQGLTMCARAVACKDINALEELKNKGFIIEQEDASILDVYLLKNTALLDVLDHKIIVALLYLGFRPHSVDKTCLHFLGDAILQELEKEDGDMNVLLECWEENKRSPKQYQSMLSKVIGGFGLVVGMHKRSGTKNSQEPEDIQPLTPPKLIMRYDPDLKLKPLDTNKKQIQLVAKNLVDHMQRSWRSWKGKCAWTASATVGTSLGLYGVYRYQAKRKVKEDVFPLSVEQQRQCIYELLKHNRT